MPKNTSKARLRSKKQARNDRRNLNAVVLDRARHVLRLLDGMDEGNPTAGHADLGAAAKKLFGAVRRPLLVPGRLPEELDARLREHSAEARPLTDAEKASLRQSTPDLDRLLPDLGPNSAGSRESCLKMLRRCTSPLGVERIRETSERCVDGPADRAAMRGIAAAAVLISEDLLGYYDHRSAEFHQSVALGAHVLGTALDLEPVAVA